MDRNKIAAIVAFIFILPVFCLAGLFLLTGSVIKALGYILSFNTECAWFEMRDVAECVKSYWYQN